MSFKPEILTTEQVAEELHALQTKKAAALLLRDQTAQRLKTIQGLMHENEALAQKSKELLKESVSLFEEERKSYPVFYPELRLQILLKATELVAPPPEKKKE